MSKCEEERCAKKSVIIVFYKKKLNQMNFKNAILEVFEDEREDGGGRVKSMRENGSEVEKVK